MASVKTAVSIQKPLFLQLDEVARELHVTRSRLVTMALEEFFEQRHNAQLLKDINAAYDDVQAAEKSHATDMKRRQRELLKDTW